MARGLHERRQQLIRIRVLSEPWRACSTMCVTRPAHGRTAAPSVQAAFRNIQALIPRGAPPASVELCLGMDRAVQPQQFHTAAVCLRMSPQCAQVIVQRQLWRRITTPSERGRCAEGTLRAGQQGAVACGIPSSNADLPRRVELGSSRAARTAWASNGDGVQESCNARRNEHAGRDTGQVVEGPHRQLHPGHR